MQVANLNKKKKRKKVNSSFRRNDPNHSSSSKDPLQSFNDRDVDLTGLGGDDHGVHDDDDDGDHDEMPDFQPEPDTKRQKTKNTPTSYAYALEGNTKSTSGRNAWKEKHKKGKFRSKKPNGTDKKQKYPLGI
jgi:hypothetical protein